MAFLRTLLFRAIFYPGTAYAVLYVLTTGWLGGRNVLRDSRRWTQFHHWCTRHLLGIETRVEGEIPTGPVLVAAKHQSMFETLELLRLLGQPVIVFKRELGDVPFFGRVARRYGVIPVDREGSSRALREMLAAAKVAVASGRPILIFPEGTRVAPGDQPPLRAGFAGLYRMIGATVVPVALDSGRLWPRKGPKRSGVVTFRFGEAIPPGQPRAEVEAQVHAAINALETERAGPAPAG